MSVEINLIKYNNSNKPYPNTFGATVSGVIPQRAEDSYEQNSPVSDIFVKLIDGKTTTIPGYYGQVLGNSGYKIQYLFPIGMNVTLDKVRMYTSENLSDSDSFLVSGLKQDGTIVNATSYSPDPTNGWQISASMGNIPIVGVVYTVSIPYPFEIQLIGTYRQINYGITPTLTKYPFEDMTGIVGHEWDIIQGKNVNNETITGPIYTDKYNLVKLFEGRFRHYFKWARFETAKDDFYLEPTNNGNFTYKTMYKQFKQDGKKIQACFQAVTTDILSLYPGPTGGGLPINDDTVPVDLPGLNKSLPSSYQRIGYAVYNLAGQFGYNTNIDISTLSLNETPLYPGDPTHNVNTLEKALGILDHFEVGNERDTWFNYPDTLLGYQNGLEFVAMMSTCYDGHLGTYPTCGIKNADPGMKVVFAGLADMNHARYKDMVEAARVLRGYKQNPDSSYQLDTNGNKIVNVPWDIIAFHYYSNTSELPVPLNTKTGCRLELTTFEEKYLRLQDVNYRFTNGLPVQIGEFGWDLSPNSTQGIIPFGSKTVQQIQADWFAAAILIFSALGVYETHLYETYSIDPTNTDYNSYGTTGLLLDNDNGTYQPSITANVIHQMNNLLRGTISDKLIRGSVWVNKRKINNIDYYCVWKPTQDDSTIQYNLLIDTPGVTSVGTYTDNGSTITMSPVTISNGQITLTVTESVQFIKVIK